MTNKKKKFNSKIRENLIALEEFRGSFEGTFKRFGSKRGNRSQHTILLTDIRDSSSLSSSSAFILCDHCWLNVGKQIQNLGHLKSSKDVIQFDARVKSYRKGSIKRGIPVKIDYKFNYPTKVKVKGKGKSTTPITKTK